MTFNGQCNSKSSRPGTSKNPSTILTTPETIETMGGAVPVISPIRDAGQGGQGYPPSAPSLRIAPVTAADDGYSYEIGVHHP